MAGAQVPARAAAPTNSFVNFETAPVHPVALSPDGATLAVCNLPDARLELFDVTSGVPVSIGSVPVGLDPVSVRFRTASEAWVANYISDSISVVEVANRRIVATLDTPDAPSDIVFAGQPLAAYVSCAGAQAVEIFDPASLRAAGRIEIEGQRPKAMAMSPDGRSVYVAIFESGNASTILAPGLGEGPRPAGVADFPDGPHGGQNPPPNRGTNFLPAINPKLTNSAPRVSVIVKKDSAGRWMDDSHGDWTEYVSGANAVFSGRRPGWDVLDHDVAVIDTENRSVRYHTGLMNICMSLAVNPRTGQLAVIGTDALNEVRFEPVLRGVFVRVNLALVDLATGEKLVQDLNPHLDYSVATVPEAVRTLSLGDPRGIVWSANGERAYITGMGSDNLVVLDAQGNRLAGQSPIQLGEGPTGLALDESRRRIYVWNRFANNISVVDLETETVIATVTLFDPTPEAIKTGRKHLYHTHQTSGLGQAACASCHVDARFDRLAWDLGDPPGELTLVTSSSHNFGAFPPSQTNHFHPMKGPMITQTLVDIIGHEPFHWRGDRAGIEEFNGTFTNLQAAAQILQTNQMLELKRFLATIHFPPNPYRRFDNSLATNLPLPGHLALGRGALPAGRPLPAGNARAGLERFRKIGADSCAHCHTLPTGLGVDLRFSGCRFQTLAPGENGERHVALIALPRSAGMLFKIPSLRNVQDKLGMNLASTRSQTGFGFLHDGSVDSLVRFLQDGFSFRDDQETANVTAFLLSFTGSDLPAGSVTGLDRPPGVPGRDVPAAVGRQITVTNAASLVLINEMIARARATTGRVDLVVHGFAEGARRGWVFDRARNLFLSDRNGETVAIQALRQFAAPDAPMTYTVVPQGAGRRSGVDRDADGYFDRTEIEFGSDPLEARSLATNISPVLIGVTIAGRALNVRWSATVGKAYRLQTANHLRQPEWIDASDIIIAQQETASAQDTSIEGVRERYYRVVQVP